MLRGDWMRVAFMAGILLAGGCSRLPALPDTFRLMPGSGTIHVDVPVPATAPDPVWAQGRSVSLALQEFADARPGSPGRKIGNIRATVRDMHATELSIDQEVSPLLAAAVRNQLVAEGFRVVSAGEGADFSLEAVIRKFSLDIAGRDELAIVADVTLRAARGTTPLWGGAVAEVTDRYAGVNGNSSASIAEYLGSGVAAFSGKVAAAVKKGVVNAPPGAGASPSPAPVRPAAAPERVAPPVAAHPASSSGVATKPSAATGTGQLWVHTTPTRAKVYVGDIYYGLTPLKVELPAGIIQLRLVLGGFRPVAEKVSVRSGDTTEFEVALEK